MSVRPFVSTRLPTLYRTSIIATEATMLVFPSRCSLAIHSSRAVLSSRLYVRPRSFSGYLPASSWQAHTLLLDTGVALLVLDGELWARSPSDLARYRQELCRDSTANINLKRSVAAYTWAKQWSNTWKGKLRITPTVIVELSRAQQVKLKMAIP